MFTRESTKQMKGIAILLMLAHHLWIMSERIPYGMELSHGAQFAFYFSTFAKICVALFMFLGGYGLYASSVKEKDGVITVKANLYKRVVKLYTSLWKVFVIFIPIGYIFFANYPQWNDAMTNKNFSSFFLPLFVANFLEYTESYNFEWWFFRSYLFALFEGFVFIQIFKNKKNVYAEVFAVIVWHILISCICPQAIEIEVLRPLTEDYWFGSIFAINDYASNFFIGIICAKYGVFDHWAKITKNWLRGEKIVVAALVTTVLAFIRAVMVPGTFDLILVPIFVFAVNTLIECIPCTKKPLQFLGNNSTNMWLTHTFYCYYFYPFVVLVYGSKNMLIDFLVLLALSLITSILLDFIWKWIGKGYGAFRGLFIVEK